MEQESYSQKIPSDGREIPLSTSKQAKEKKDFAIKDFKENDILLQKSQSCNTFQGIQFNAKSDDDIKTLNVRFVSLCSKLDERRWSTVSSYRGKGFTAYRGECSR